MYDYSPFDRGIRHLRPMDLAVLRGVSEGWHVEYKRELVSARALAKAVSAFANTYGGWIFLGVQEAAHDTVAGAFPGLPEPELTAALDTLRQSADRHLSPVPHFETKVLRGPCEDIGLRPGTAVVAIEVPRSPTAPHVHGDGRIYRRVADGSEPRPETDRLVLDQLWRRGEIVREAIRKWVSQDPDLSEVEAETPYARLLLTVDPWRQRMPWLGASGAQIKAIMKSDKIGLQSVPFDTFYTSADGYIARQAKGNDPYSYVLTWKIRMDLDCEIVFPWPLYVLDGGNRHREITSLGGYDHAERLIRLFQEKGYLRPRVVDLNLTIALLIGFVEKYRALMRLAGEDGTFYFKVRVLNTWRVVPFLDVAEVLQNYETDGLPVIMDSSVTFPPGDGPESFHPIDERALKGEKGGPGFASQVQGTLIFVWIARAMGVPVLVEGERKSDAQMPPIDALLQAANRALAVQRNRIGVWEGC